MDTAVESPELMLEKKKRKKNKAEGEEGYLQEKTREMTRLKGFW